VSNLLSKAEGAIADQVEPKYFDNANEFSLYSAIQQADQAVQPMAAARQYNGAGPPGRPARPGRRFFEGGAGQRRRRQGAATVMPCSALRVACSGRGRHFAAGVSL
jgi:hypothetical protein